MRQSKMTVLATLIMELMMFNVQRATGQTGQPVSATGPSDEASAEVVTGQPFSATKYSRTVKILPDGKQQFIRNEHYPLQMGRDPDGRVRFQVLDPQPECDQPTSPVPPTCPDWGIILFDLAAHTVTHWPEGEIGAHVAVVIPLSQSQVEDAEHATSVMPKEDPQFDTEAPNVITENLGTKVLEGVRVTGVRKTKVGPPEYSGNKVPIMPITLIHEVWTSAEMRLVIRIIDGNPQFEETISGIEKVSLQPDAALFQPPVGYEIQHRGEKKDDSKYADEDVTWLAKWFAK